MSEAYKFPLLAIAKQLEDEAQLEGAKEVYERALTVTKRKDAQELIDRTSKTHIPVDNVIKEAQAAILRVETKQRKTMADKLQITVPPIYIEVNKIKPFNRLEGVIPAIDSRDYANLLKGIKERGIQIPLIINAETNEIVCGYNRWRAAREIGLKVIPAWKVWMKTDAAIMYAIDDNLNRRHLTDAERVGLAASKIRALGKPQKGRPRTGSTLPTITSIARDAKVPLKTVEKQLYPAKKPSTEGISGPRQKEYFVEKVERKFKEVKGLEWETMHVDMGQDIYQTLLNLALTEEDHIRAIVTIFVRRKE